MENPPAAAKKAEASQFYIVSVFDVLSELITHFYGLLIPDSRSGDSAIIIPAFIFFMCLAKNLLKTRFKFDKGPLLTRMYITETIAQLCAHPKGGLYE